MKVSRGRATTTSLIAGLPVIWIGTIGARTGRPHEVPLMGIPLGDGDLGLIGTNFGSDRTPAWAHNLLANPDVDVRFGDVKLAVRSEVLGEDDAARVWQQAVALYPNFARYRSSASREIPVFRLESRSGA